MKVGEFMRPDSQGEWAACLRRGGVVRVLALQERWDFRPGALHGAPGTVHSTNEIDVVVQDMPAIDAREFMERDPHVVIVPPAADSLVLETKKLYGSLRPLMMPQIVAMKLRG